MNYMGNKFVDFSKKNNLKTCNISLIDHKTNS